jgi:hypothetical protein
MLPKRCVDQILIASSSRFVQLLSKPREHILVNAKATCRVNLGAGIEIQPDFHLSDIATSED